MLLEAVLHPRTRLVRKRPGAGLGSCLDVCLESIVLTVAV